MKIINIKSKEEKLSLNFTPFIIEVDSEMMLQRPYLVNHYCIQPRERVEGEGYLYACRLCVAKPDSFIPREDLLGEEINLIMERRKMS